jgi:predicted transcriptional regulator
MTLNEVKDILQAEVLTSNFDTDMHIELVCSTDLMSDVLAFSQSGDLLLTGLVDGAAVRTADIAHVKAIVFVRGKRPSKETVALAEEKKIPLLITKLSMFESCGRLYVKNLRSSINAG